MDTFPKVLGALGALVLALCVTEPALADDASVLRDAVAAERARAPAPRFARGDFLVRAAIHEVRLSPDGGHVAYLRDDDRSRGVWLLPTAGGEPRRLLAHSDAQHLHWSRDGRWLLLQSERRVFALAATGQAGSGVVTSIGGRERRELLAVDSTQAAALVIREHLPAALATPGRWRLLRVDMRGRRTLLHEDAQKLTDFALAPDGRLAFLQRVEDQALVIHRVDADGRLHEIKRCVHMMRCGFVATTGAGDLLLRGDLGGDLNRLLRLDADGRVHTLHADPRGEADLDALTLDPLSGRPLIASYRSTVPASYGLSAAAQRHLDAIARQLPGRDLHLQIGRGAAAHWLVGAAADNLQAPRWYLYDPRGGDLREILAAPPLRQRDDRPTRWLPEAALARKIPFAYPASDGMRLHGFLLLPPGADPATLPLVTDVHGGPWSRTGPGYERLPQLLVNRGYAVFQPNFRGSTGYGRQYQLAADGDFGNGRVQQDIVDGVRHLLAHGIGDPDRVGIVGYSFGGYAALLGVTFAPELFKVGVAGGAPPDFAWDLLWVSRNSEALHLSERFALTDWLRMLAVDIEDPEVVARLHAQSPLGNADRLHRPLLMIAAGKDRRVPIRGVLGYAAKLELLRKDVSLLVDPDAGHEMDDPLLREAYAYLLEAMLHRHLGGDPPAPPDAQLGDYLERNLRLRGPSLPLSIRAPDAR